MKKHVLFHCLLISTATTFAGQASLDQLLQDLTDLQKEANTFIAVGGSPTTVTSAPPLPGGGIPTSPPASPGGGASAATSPTNSTASISSSIAGLSVSTTPASTPGGGASAATSPTNSSASTSLSIAGLSVSTTPASTPGGGASAATIAALQTENQNLKQQIEELTKENQILKQQRSTVAAPTGGSGVPASGAIPTPPVPGGAGGPPPAPPVPGGGVGAPPAPFGAPPAPFGAPPAPFGAPPAPGGVVGGNAAAKAAEKAAALETLKDWSLKYDLTMDQILQYLTIQVDNAFQGLDTTPEAIHKSTGIPKAKLAELKTDFGRIFTGKGDKAAQTTYLRLLRNAAPKAVKGDGGAASKAPTGGGMSVIEEMKEMKAKKAEKEALQKAKQKAEQELDEIKSSLKASQEDKDAAQEEYNIAKKALEDWETANPSRPRRGRRAASGGGAAAAKKPATGDDAAEAVEQYPIISGSGSNPNKRTITFKVVAIDDLKNGHINNVTIARLRKNTGLEIKEDKTKGTVTFSIADPSENKWQDIHTLTIEEAKWSESDDENDDE